MFWSERLVCCHYVRNVKMCELIVLHLVFYCSTGESSVHSRQKAALIVVFKITAFIKRVTGFSRKTWGDYTIYLLNDTYSYHHY